MRYEIFLAKPAQKFIMKQQLPQRQRLFAAINKLPYEGDIKPLAGYTDRFRLRVGDYRVIYRVENTRLIVFVIDIGNRGDVYKK